MIIKSQPRKIDPEKVTYQFEKLTTALLGIAMDERAKEMKASHKKSTAKSHAQPLTMPLTLNSKAR